MNKTQLKNVTPKIKQYLNNYVFNTKFTDKTVDAKLFEIKKKGIKEPVAPINKRNKDPVAKQEHQALREVYDQELKQYNKYRSQDYQDLRSKFKLYNMLEALNKAIEANKPKSADDLKTKLANPKYDLQKFIGQVDLNNSSDVNAAMTKLVSDDLELMLKKHKLASEKTRFSKDSMKLIFEIVRSFSLAVSNQAFANLTRNKDPTLTPAHFLVPDNEWHSILTSLTCYKMLEDRNKRQDAHNKKHHSDMINILKEAHIKAELESKSFKKPKEPADMFNDFETQQGYAERRTKVSKRIKKDGSNIEQTKYVWKGIDDLDNRPEVKLFMHYSDLLLEFVADKHMNQDISLVIRVSKRAKAYFAGLVVELINNFSTIIKGMLGISKRKTIDGNLILNAFVAGYNTLNPAYKQELTDKLTKAMIAKKVRKPKHIDDTIEAKPEPKQPQTQSKPADEPKKKQLQPKK
jgi:hypothetical protein